MVSEYNKKRIEEWKKLTKLRYEANDHTSCPKCNEQAIVCECCVILAQEIMESLFYREFKALG